MYIKIAEVDTFNVAVRKDLTEFQIFNNFTRGTRLTGKEMGGGGEGYIKAG